MKIGTKSVLFGVHQFMIHPWFVAVAWWKLFGFPWDPRLWIAFFVHDLGYIGKPNMDGKEGEQHVVWGANLMHFFFDRPRIKQYALPSGSVEIVWNYRWLDFCLLHSRFWAKQLGKPVSKLCIADKFSIALTPAWLYLPMARWTGEIHEYMKLAKARTEAGEPKYASMKFCLDTQQQWYADVQEYLRQWVREHKDGQPDTWTPLMRQAKTDSGVWK